MGFRKLKKIPESGGHLSLADDVVGQGGVRRLLKLSGREKLDAIFLAAQLLFVQELETFTDRQLFALFAPMAIGQTASRG